MNKAAVVQKCYRLGNMKHVEVRYSSKEIERICTQSSYMQKKLGAPTAKKLRLRIAELMSAITMDDLLLGAGRWERLHGDRQGQWSARLTANWRLIVEPLEAEVIAVLVVEIVDYHRK